MGKNPFAGRSRDEIRPGYRSFPVGQYVVFYRLSDSGVQIMHEAENATSTHSLGAEST